MLDDEAMLIVVGELLEHPDDPLNPELLRELLTRLRELLEQETTRRPGHRPRADKTGSLVALMISCGTNPAMAKRLVAKVRRKSVRTVAKAYERHQRRSDKSKP